MSLDRLSAYITANRIFGLLVGQNKSFEDIAFNTNKQTNSVHVYLLPIIYLFFPHLHRHPLNPNLNVSQIKMPPRLQTFKLRGARIRLMA